ncbi:MAG: hypothetical protein IKT89_04255 [Clostridia bacterium]|nr:hypothetical protein [Clostridia bacterium]
MAKHYHCPVNGWDCPYYKNEQNGDFCLCGMKKNPYYECEDFRAEWDGYREADYTDDHD